MPMFQVGDKVKIAPNGLAQHSKSVPAHMGYTSDQFKWRKTISDLQDAGKVGRVTRVSGDNVDCDFGGANEIVLYDYLLVKESSRATAILDKILLKHINESEPLPIGDGWYIMRTGMDANGNYCAWVARGDNAARKIQTNGTAPTAHHKNPNEIVKSDKAMAELRDYANKYFDTDESLKEDSGAGSLADMHNKIDDLLTKNGIKHSLTMSYTESTIYIKLYDQSQITQVSNMLKVRPSTMKQEDNGWVIPLKVHTSESNDDDVEAKKKDLEDWTAKAKAELDKKKDDAPKPKDEELSVPDRHQLAIAKKTLQMSDAGARIMGGMTKEEARAIIKKLTGKDAKEEPEDECMESDAEEPSAAEFGAGFEKPKKEDEDTHPAITAYNKVRDRETDDEKRASAWGKDDKPKDKDEELDAAEMQPYDQLTRSDNEPNDKDGEDMDKPGMNKLDPKQLGENDIRPLAIGTRVKIQYGIGSNPQDDMLTGRIVDSGTKGENRKVKVKTDSGEQIDILSTAVTPTSEAIASYDIVPGDKKNWSVRKDGVEVHACDKEDEAKKHIRKLQGFKEAYDLYPKNNKGQIYRAGGRIKITPGNLTGTIVNLEGNVITVKWDDMSSTATTEIDVTNCPKQIDIIKESDQYFVNYGQGEDHPNEKVFNSESEALKFVDSIKNKFKDIFLFHNIKCLSTWTDGKQEKLKESRASKVLKKIKETALGSETIPALKSMGIKVLKMTRANGELHYLVPDGEEAKKLVSFLNRQQQTLNKYTNIRTQMQGMAVDVIVSESFNEESPDDLVVVYKGPGDTSWHIQYNPMGTHSSETANRTADALIKQYGQNNVKIMKRHEAENSGLMEDYQANVKRFPKGTKVKFNSHCSNPDLVGKEGTVEMVMSGQPDKTQIAVRLPSRDGVFTHADSLDIVESFDAQRWVTAAKQYNIPVKKVSPVANHKVTFTVASRDADQMMKLLRSSGEFNGISLQRNEQGGWFDIDCLVSESKTNEDLDSSCNKIWHLAKEIVQEVDDLTDYIHGSEFNKSESRASKILKRVKEDMHLTQLGPNQTEIRVGGKYVLFSYQTPVAYSDESGNCFRTATNYSTTTSKHINAWLGGRQAKSVPQEQISKAAGQ